MRLKKLNDKMDTDKGSYTVVNIYKYKELEIYKEKGIRKGDPITFYSLSDDISSCMFDTMSEAKECCDEYLAGL